MQKALANSPGILQGHDPWVWESNISLYRTLPNNDTTTSPSSYASTLEGLLSNRKLFLVGDSLTRQWARTIHCELVHVLNKTVAQANAQVQYVQVHDLRTSIPSGKFRKLLKPSKLDFVVWNTGHHVGPGKVNNWTEAYEENMAVAHKRGGKATFGAVPDSHIFFRTTTIRHFLKGRGDWNTNTSEAGGAAPDMDARWSAYGGSSPAQPLQNQIALHFLQREGRFGLLDISPMMLARADASFDGSHICLPGPMTHWSRMLYYRIQQLDLREKEGTQS